MSTVEAFDLVTAEEVLSRAYTRVQLSAPGAGSAPRGSAGRPLLSLQHQECGPLASLDRIDLALDAASACEPLGAWVFTHVHAGRVTFDVRRGGRERSTAYGPGRVHLGSAPDERYRARFERLRGDVVVITPDLLAQVDDGGTSGAVRFTSDGPLSADLQARWVATCSAVAGVLTGHEAAGTGTATAQAAQLLAMTALAVFPNSTWDDAGSLVDRRDSRDARAVTHRRAVAFIEEHADGHTSPVQVAQACGVSVRTLQLAFRRHGGTTPGAHLRGIRLARAHRDLEEAPAAGGDLEARRGLLEAVAQRWGFGSVRAFATAHQQTYGRAPAGADS